MTIRVILSVLMSAWLTGGLILSGQLMPTAAGAPNVHVPPVSPPSSGLHAYFDGLKARADLYHAYSLRDQAQLITYRSAGTNKPPIRINYIYQNDPDPRKQDAAKIVMPAGIGSLPIDNQLKLPFGTLDGNSYLTTWDAWYGSEMVYNNTAIINYKTFNFLAPRVANGVPAIWGEINNRWSLAKADAGELTGRYYATSTTPAGPGITAYDPVQPQVVRFIIKPETWTRYWVLIEQKVNGDAWTRFSLWVADPTRGPTLILDQLPYSAPNGGVPTFLVEYNTSTDTTPAGDRVSYIKNVIMLRNPVAPLAIMQRP